MDQYIYRDDLEMQEIEKHTGYFNMNVDDTLHISYWILVRQFCKTPQTLYIEQPGNTFIIEYPRIQQFMPKNLTPINILLKENSRIAPNLFT